MNDGTQTLVTLRDYLEERLAAHCALNEARFRSIEEATRKASEIMDIRLAGMNEFRNAMKDQTARYVTGERIDRVEERLKGLEIRQSNLDGRLAAYAAALGLFLTAVAIAIRFVP